MTIMLGKVYAALKAAGTPDEQAQAAAEEVGDLHDQFGGLRSEMKELRADVKGELQGLRSELGELRLDFRNEMGELRSDFRNEIGELRSDFRNEMGDLRSDFRTELGKLREDFRAELSESRTEARSESAGLRSEIAYLRGRFDVLIWAAGLMPRPPSPSSAYCCGISPASPHVHQIRRRAYSCNGWRSGIPLW